MSAREQYGVTLKTGGSRPSGLGKNTLCQREHLKDCLKVEEVQVRIVPFEESPHVPGQKQRNFSDAFIMD